MSSDGTYIFVYEDPGYVSPTPMEKDKKYLESEYGGGFIDFRDGFYWSMPKYRLYYEMDKILADQVFERVDAGLFKLIK